MTTIGIGAAARFRILDLLRGMFRRREPRLLLDPRTLPEHLQRDIGYRDDHLPPGSVR